VGPGPAVSCKFEGCSGCTAYFVFFQRTAGKGACALSGSLWLAALEAFQGATAVLPLWQRGCALWTHCGSPPSQPSWRRGACTVSSRQEAGGYTQQRPLQRMHMLAAAMLVCLAGCGCCGMWGLTAAFLVLMEGAGSIPVGAETTLAALPAVVGGGPSKCGVTVPLHLVQPVA
jgi:hypothetical protein